MSLTRLESALIMQENLSEKPQDIPERLNIRKCALNL